MSAPPIRMIAWELTQACNLACRHCRAAAVDRPSPAQLTTGECRSLLDHIASFASPTIILTGGEPLLRPDFFDIAAHAASRGIRAVAAVNGLLLDQAKAQRMLDVAIRRISISIDGKNAAQHDSLRAVPGAFEGALRGIAAAREVGARIFLQPVAGPTQPSDLDHYTQVRCYQQIVKKFPRNMILLGLIPLALRGAGPREALWQAIVRKNFGCSQFIVAADQADPLANGKTRERFYPLHAAQELVQACEHETGIRMVPMRKMV